MQEQVSICPKPVIVHTIKDISHERGGMPVAVLGLLQAIGNQTKTVSLKLVASQGAQPLLNPNQSCPSFEWQAIPESTSHSLRCWLRQIRQETAAKQPCLLHDHGIWLLHNHSIAKNARCFKIPRVVSVHGMLEPWAWQYKAWKKRTAWMLFQHHDLITAQVLHATSESEAAHIRELCPRVPVAVIPLGVEVSPQNTQPAPSKQRIVLFLSRIHPKKGLLNLIDAWHQLQPHGWKLMIVGPDENGHKSLVEKKVRSLQLDSSVQFQDAVSGEAKWELYRKASLFVLPTLSENFGIVVAEALACGTPVITTKGAPWSDLDTYQCGWWIDTGISPLVEALQRAMTLSQEELNTMGYRGKLLVESKYSWNRTAEQMVNLYLWILGYEKKPLCVVD